MPDNTQLNVGSGGDIIATDEIDGVKHQQVKLEWGPDGTVNQVDDVAGKRLPVNVAESALPSGASTEATLASILTELAQKTEPGDTQPVSGPLTDAQLRAAVVPVLDRFTGGEVLADQSGAGAALTFTFSSAVHLIWVRCDGGDGRADPFGGTPTADAGIVCEDGIPNPITVTATTVKVFAAIGTTVHVWGYRY